MFWATSSEDILVIGFLDCSIFIFVENGLPT